MKTLQILVVVALIATLVVLVAVAVVYTETTTNIYYNKTCSNTTTTDFHYFELINKFVIEEVRQIEGCIYLKGHVKLNLNNTVHVLICGKVYVFAEIELPPPSP